MLRCKSDASSHQMLFGNYHVRSSCNASVKKIGREPVNDIIHRVQVNAESRCLLTATLAIIGADHARPIQTGKHV